MDANTYHYNRMMEQRDKGAAAYYGQVCDFCDRPTTNEPRDGERLCHECRCKDARRAGRYHYNHHTKRIEYHIPSFDNIVSRAHSHLPSRCKARINKAVEIVKAGGVVLIDDGSATVESQSGEDSYDVDVATGCNCPDATQVGWRGAPRIDYKPACKHQIAVWLVKAMRREGVAI